MEIIYVILLKFVTSMHKSFSCNEPTEGAIAGREPDSWIHLIIYHHHISVYFPCCSTNRNLEVIEQQMVNERTLNTSNSDCTAINHDAVIIRLHCSNGNKLKCNIFIEHKNTHGYNRSYNSMQHLQHQQHSY
jgi:hypothetical protein